MKRVYEKPSVLNNQVIQFETEASGGADQLPTDPLTCTCTCSHCRGKNDTNGHDKNHPGHCGNKQNGKCPHPKGHQGDWSKKKS